MHTVLQGPLAASSAATDLPKGIVAAALLAMTKVASGMVSELVMAKEKVISVGLVVGVVEASLAREALGMVEQEVAVVVRVVKDLVV